MGDEQPALRVTGLTREFSDVVVLNDVTFELHSGQTLALTGVRGFGR